MATHSFGTDINPAHYTEIADPANPGQVKRPPAGQTLLVQDAANPGVNLAPSITTTLYGYWDYQTTDIPAIVVSADGGVSWIGPLFSKESSLAENAAGALATQAMTVAAAASATAQQALAAASGANVKFRDLATNTDINGPVFTLGGIHARDTRVEILPSEVQGLAAVAVSGASGDLTDANDVGGAVLLGTGPTGAPEIPIVFLPAGAGGGGFTPVFQNADGSWDPRTAHSTDSAEILLLIPRDVTKPKPPLGTDGVAYYEPNPALGIPGDILANLGYTT